MNHFSDAVTSGSNIRHFIDHSEHMLYHRDKVAEVIELANRSDRKPSGLSAFSIARTRRDPDDAGYVQIRATSLSARDALEFRYHLRAVGDIEIDAASWADGLPDAACSFVGMNTPEVAAEINTAVDAAIREAVSASSPLRIVAVGLCPTASGEHHAITVEVETLGEDLAAEVARVTGFDLEELAGELARVADKHVQRDKLLASAIALDATNWIDGTARRIIESAGVPITAVVGFLRQRQCCEFVFRGPGARDFQAAFYWVAGVLKADLCPEDEKWSFSDDTLSIPHPGHPDTLLTAWAGRRIGEVVEQDFVPADAVIVETDTRLDEWLDIKVEVEPLPLMASLASALLAAAAL